MKYAVVGTRWLWLAVVVGMLGLWSGPAAHAQVPGFEWAVACGSAASSDYGVGASQVAVDAQGNTYVLGPFAGTIQVGNTTLTAVGAPTNPPYSQYDIFVAKLDAQGQYQWAVRLGGDRNETGTGLAVDAAGGVYLTGQFNSYSLSFGTGGPTLYNSSSSEEVFVAKLSTQTGQCLWARRAGGGGSDSGQAITVTAQGEVCVAGCFNANNTIGFMSYFGTTTFTGHGAFVAKLDGVGNWLWAVRSGGGAGTYPASLAVDATGSLYVAGYFLGTPPCTATFGSATLTGLVVPGYDKDVTYDGFVAKLDATGNWLWAVQGDAAGHNLVMMRSLVTDGQGHLYASGIYRSTAARFGSITLPNLSAIWPPSNPAPPIPYTAYYSDIFVTRLDAATGAWQWAVRAGGSGEDGIHLRWSS